MKKKIKDIIAKEIYNLTILIATAREEGDDEEHKRVVGRIMEIVEQALQQERERIIEKIEKFPKFDFSKNGVSGHLAGEYYLKRDDLIDDLNNN